MRIALACLAAISASAQHREEAPFTADRPGFAVTADTVAPGYAQIETGLGYARSREAGRSERVLSGGSPLARVAVTERLELRFGGEGFRWSEAREGGVRERRRGWSDIAVGAKWKVLGEGRVLPAVALAPGLSSPVGHARFSSGSYDASLTAAWSKSLAGSWSAGGSFTAGAQASAGVLANRAFGERLSAFAEVYRAGGWTMADAGVARSVGRDAQIDLSSGRRIDAGAPCWFVFAGFSLRYRFHSARR